MSDGRELIGNAMQALDAWLRRDGLPRFDTAAIVADAMLRLHDSEVEALLAYWLDSENRLLKVDLVAKGSADQLTMSRNYLARCAAIAGATHAVLVHNHPSEDPTPSEVDRDTADRIDLQLSAIGVLVIGHHVIARNGVGDVRTAKTITFEDIGWMPRAPEGPRCPRCRCPLETAT